MDRVTERNRRPVRRRATAAALLSLAVLLLAAGGCRRDGAGPEPEVPRNVRILVLAPVDFTEALEFSGVLRPVRGTDLGAEEGGTVVAIPRDKGETVAAGEIVVRLDDRLAAAELERARAELRLRAFDADRTARLFAAGKVSEREKLAAESARDQAAAAVRAAEVRLDHMRVTAPFAGIVAARDVEPGQLVLPGARVARVVALDTLKVVGGVTEREVPWIRAGAAAEIVLDDGTRSAGTVAFVAPEGDPVDGKFAVEVVVPDTGHVLRPGVVARVRLAKRVHHGVLAIPRDAVITTPAGTEVYVVEGDRARLRDVVLGPGQGLLVMVREGLRPGERLVVRGQRDLVEGALVSVTETAARPDGSLAPAATDSGEAAR